MKIFVIGIFCATAIISSTLKAQLTFTENSVNAGVNDGDAGQGIVFADFDNDGYLDFYVVNHDGGLSVLYMNNGDGTFTENAAVAGIAVTAGGEGAVWLDYDKDGLMDIYVANEAGANALYHNNGDGTFTNEGGATGSDILGTAITALVADYNNDGLSDIYIVNLTGSNVLLKADLEGNYTDVTNSAGVGDAGAGISGSWGDFNGDGFADLYVVNRGSASNVLYENNGDGTFSNVTSSSGTSSSRAGYGCAVGDYDNDGDLDIYVSNFGANQLFQNDGSGTFIDVATTAGVHNSLNSLGVSFGDLDNDGDLDIYVVNDNGANALYINDGSGIFGDSTAVAGVGDASGVGQGTAFGDIDNDGDLDIYVTNFNQPNVFFINDGSSNHFLHINLKGLANDANGIGTTVTLHAGGTSQSRIVEGGGGFSSHSSPTVEFGLGSLISVDSIVVSWPYGREQTILIGSIDTVITITEDIYEYDLIAGLIIGIPSNEMIVEGDSILPSAVVGNIGDSTVANYYAKLTISSNEVIDYEDSLLISSPLEGFATVNLEFPVWIPSLADTYDVKLFVGLTVDQSVSNNMISSRSIIRFAVPPTVEVTKPSDGDTEVSASLARIDATFTEGVVADSLNSNTFFVEGSVSGLVPGLVLYSALTKRVTFIIDNTFDFASDELVTVTISGDLPSLFGLTLDGNLNGTSDGSPTDDFIWSFTVETITGVDDEIETVPDEYSLLNALSTTQLLYSYEAP